jgi:hypothetical protein
MRTGTKSLTIAAWLALAACGVLAGWVAPRPAMSQQAQRPSADGQQPGAAAPEQARPDESAFPDRQSAPVIAPRMLIKVPEEAPPQVLEQRVFNRRCRLVKPSGSAWFVLEFFSEPDQPALPPQRVLPCQWLALMEQQNSPDKVFHVTGDLTGYHAALYILPVAVTSDAPISAEPVVPTGPAATGKKKAPPAASSPTATPLPAPAIRPAGSQPSAQDRPDSKAILAQMLVNRPGKPMTMPALIGRAPADNTPSVAPLPTRELVPVDSTQMMVIDRTVRIQRRGEWYEARFLSDNTLQERPIRLLPNSLLERAEKIPGRIRITGVIQRYKDQDFLLLRKVILYRDMGQF